MENIDSDCNHLFDFLRLIFFFTRVTGWIGQDKLKKGYRFFITLFLLIQTLTAGQQLQFMREKDPGMNMERTVVVHTPGGEHKALKDELLRYPEFEPAGSAHSFPVRASPT